MENNEEIPGLPVENAFQEENDLDRELFDNTPAKKPFNPFLSRGCCQPPRMYHKNESSFGHQCSKFDSLDWMKDIPPVESKRHDIVEVRFKNSRKEFFRMPPDMELQIGDMVAVEASPGHDIGIVSMTGELVRVQLRKRNPQNSLEELKKVYRKARLTDIEKWITAVEQELSTLYRSREIAEQLGLQMKINDVEYQGDNTKAIFYYTADDRVDFRELIKLLAEEFKIRIEMRQIGARQEASRLGGIGPCGRELCCSTWINDFKSVTTGAARIQQLSLNPQKLAGQCGKLKCCLNFEYETYLDALKGIPDPELRLKTKRGEAVHQKTDIFRRIMWYSYVSDMNNLLAIPVDQVILIQEENKKGNLPDKLEDYCQVKEKKSQFESGAGQDDLTRFDHL